MKPVLPVLAAGLIAGLSGCSNLHQSLMFRPATDRSTVAREEVDNGPADLFHRPSETPTARIARYFPGLMRPEKAATPPTSEGTWRGRGNPDLRAVPREAATDADATTTAAGRPRSYRSPTTRQVEVASRREEVAQRSGAEPMPLLAGAVVAETDPSEGARGPAGLPELTPAEQALRAARVAEMTSSKQRSVRRMPPMPAVNPLLAARSDSTPGQRPATRDEDSQARRVRTQVDDGPVPIEPKPVAVVAVAPAAEAPRSLAPPVDGPDPQPVAEPVPPDERPHPVAAKPPIAVEAPKPVEPDGPPPIEPSPTEPAASKESRSTPIPPQAVADPDTGGDATLAGRPRMTQVQPIRDHVPPDLPAVSFPRSYYTSGQLAAVAPRPKVDPETRPARWTWTPKLIRRLRGESSPDQARAAR